MKVVIRRFFFFHFSSLVLGGDYYGDFALHLPEIATQCLCLFQTNHHCWFQKCKTHHLLQVRGFIFLFFYFFP